MTQLQGMPICNIVRTEIITEGENAKTFTWETSSSADLEPVVSKGESKTLRVKNTVYASNMKEDIVTGNDIKFTDNLLNPEVLAIIDGGELRYDAVDKTKVIGYDAPSIGQDVNRKSFTLNVYTEEKDADGTTIKFAKFNFPHCKGTPVKYTLKDGEFFTPQFTVHSQPKKGENPYTIDFLEKLPEIK